jgi:hypothetical protein
MGRLLAPEIGQFAPQIGHAVLGVGVAPQDEFHASSPNERRCAGHLLTNALVRVNCVTAKSGSGQHDARLVYDKRSRGL